MLEISCILDSGDVFLSGHLVRCHITLHCLLSNSSGSNRQSTEPECLAWLSAQVQCFCQTNSQVVLSEGQQRGRGQVSGSTAYRPALGERGRLLMTTGAQILACDVHLRPGESHTVSYNQRLPAGLPPSYRGHAVRYSYKIAIAAQRVGGSVRMLRAPIRVLALQRCLAGADNMDNDCESPFGSGNVAPANPFLVAEDNDRGGDEHVPLLDHCSSRRSLQLLRLSAGKRSLNLFNITNQHGRVLRFSVFKLAYRLGEDIVAVLEFSDSQVTCVQYSVRLESVETVFEKHRLPANVGKYRPHVQQYSKSQEVCLNLRRTSVCLSIPANATASFSSSLMRLEWRVHLEFVIKSGPLPTVNSSEIYWQAPQAVDVETMIWDLPIEVHPACPVYLHHMATRDQQAPCMRV